MKNLSNLFPLAYSGLVAMRGVRGGQHDQTLLPKSVHQTSPYLVLRAVEAMPTAALPLDVLLGLPQLAVRAADGLRGLRVCQSKLNTCFFNS